MALLLGIMLVGLGLRPDEVRASHLQAGDIQAKVDTTAAHNPRRIFFKMIVYTYNASNVPMDKVTIFFGDNTSSCFEGVMRARKAAIPGNADTSVNIYYFDHIFPSSGPFTVSYIGENRNAGVRNMTNSDSQSFYISTSIVISPSLGLNHSVVLTAPAVDKAAIGQVFSAQSGRV